MKLGICMTVRSGSMSRIAQGVVRTLALGSLVLSSLFSGVVAVAQPGGPKAKPVDVVLLFDTSGSMLKTDPMQLRFKGAKQITKFLGKGDRLAVIGFSDKAQVVRPLKYYAPEVAQEFDRELSQLGTAGQHTDIFEGIMAAEKMIDTNYRAGVEKAIVLISDGKMEPNPAKGMAFAHTLALVHDQLPVLKSKQTRIYTIALSDAADRPLLREIAGSTEGVAFYAASASELERAFEMLFEAMVPSHSPAAITRKFYVEESAEEAIFYVSHAPGIRISLVSPRGDHMSPVQKPEHTSWFTGEKFDLITVREPESGDWEVQGIEPADSFVVLLADLKFAIDFPVAARAGEPELLQARLYEGEKPVSLPHMSGVLKFAFQVTPTDRVSAPVLEGVLNDDGKNGDKVAQDGVFSTTITLTEEGDYRLGATAKSPTFERAKQLPFKVKPKLIALETVAHHGEHDVVEPEERSEGETAAEEHEGTEHGGLVGDETVTFRATVSKEVTRFKDVSVSLIARSSDKKRLEIPLKRSVEDPYVYEVSAEALPRDGRYTVFAQIKALEKPRMPVRSETPELVFTRRMAPRSEAETPVKVVVRAPEAAEKPQEFPLIPVLVISAINLVLGLAAYLFLWKKPTVRSAPTPKYIPQKALLEAISQLESRVSKADISVDDPLFQQAGPATEDEKKPMEAQQETAAQPAPAEQAAATEAPQQAP